MKWQNDRPQIAQFSKVSKERFLYDFTDTFPQMAELAADVYEDIKLPKRATSGSAGYDFFLPVNLDLHPGESIKIPTGIRAELSGAYVLMLFPRSSLGFKYRLQLNNTVGIIDSDYAFAENEGHIFIKLTNDSNEGKMLSLKSGTAFAQGVFVPFGITVDDEAEGVRTGGMGSTDNAE